MAPIPVMVLVYQYPILPEVEADQEVPSHLVQDQALELVPEAAQDQDLEAAQDLEVEAALVYPIQKLKVLQMLLFNNQAVMLVVVHILEDTGILLSTMNMEIMLTP